MNRSEELELNYGSELDQEVGELNSMSFMDRVDE
jgi:hypothetical protein